jgi:hypothetical protein
MQISTVNRPSISLKGPVKVPQKEQCGPTPHPWYSNQGHPTSAPEYQAEISAREGSEGHQPPSEALVLRSWIKRR